MKVEVLIAEGCAHCNEAIELLKDLQEDLDFKLETLDLMDNPKLANTYDIMVSPGIIVGGELVSQGVPDRDELRQILEERSDED